MLKLLLAAILASRTFATPVHRPRLLTESQKRQGGGGGNIAVMLPNPSDMQKSPYNLTVSQVGPKNDSLPTVAIFATGGTIAGSAGSATDSTQYTAGVLGISALLNAVPEIGNISNVVGAQIVNVGSPDVNSTIVLAMAKLAHNLLCSENSTVSGLVITHGTDTLEETAFYMDSLVNCSKPVVVVGAMRPATAISADGPANLLEAVTLAIDPAARDRGTMIVLNDRIGQAVYTQKRNANVLDTFGANEQGYIGGFLSTKPFFYYPAVQPVYKHVFDVTKLSSLPKVDILYGHQDQDWILIPAAMDAGAKGIVIAGTGAGSFTSASLPAVGAALDEGIPIVSATKTNNGAVTPDDQDPWIHAGFLNPVKCRIRLQLALASGMNFNQTKDTFEKVLTSYIGDNAE